MSKYYNQTNAEISSIKELEEIFIFTRHWQQYIVSGKPIPVQLPNEHLQQLYEIAESTFKQYRSIHVINILMKCYLIEIADETNLFNLKIFSNLIKFVYESKSYEIEELASIFASNETRTKMADIFCFGRDGSEIFKPYCKTIYLSGRAKG